MLSRINFIKIINGHFGTLRSLNQSSKTIYWQDFILFILFPIIVASSIIYFDLEFRNQITNLIAAISILGGFLFNLLAIIYNSMENLEKDSKKSTIKQKYIKEIHSNISYNILLSIFTIIFLIVYNIDFNLGCTTTYISKILTFINSFLISSFLLTLLMVLNRVYILLNKNIEDKNKPSS